jgi:hypothetical protein
MNEANHRLQQASAIGQAQRTAIAVIAQRAAIRETKAAMQRQGLKPATIPHREIVAAANGYLRDHRAELVAEARAIVARWEADGMFAPRPRRPRANISSPAQRTKP